VSRKRAFRLIRPSFVLDDLENLPEDVLPFRDFGSAVRTKGCFGGDCGRI
jgi:hypothetical protein